MNRQNTLPDNATGMVSVRCFIPTSMNGGMQTDRICYRMMPLEWSVRDALLLLSMNGET